tara:strand:+ start:1811 stop:3652 length:1842 start_codon:yes stop_codon:yes gene_type:complete
MVKLLRITSTDNANFNADLDAGIDLKSDASIALKNLTFESDFVTLTINSSSDEVKFQLDSNNVQDGIRAPIAPPGFIPFPPFLTGKTRLKPGSYSASNYKEFYPDLEGALNDTLAVGIGASNNYGDVYSSFFVDTKTNADRPRIMYKYATMNMPFNNNVGTERTNDEEWFNEPVDADQALTLDINKSGANLNSIKQVPAGTTGDVYDKYIYNNGGNANVKWCQGSAMWMTSLLDIRDVAGAANIQGFGIGLSYTDLESFQKTDATEPLTLAERDYEVILNKTDQTYQFISPSLPNTVRDPAAPVIPFKFDLTIDTNELTHDRILFERKLGVISAKILTTAVAGGTETELFSHKLSKEDRKRPLYPYIYVKGDAANCVVGTPVVTMDPFMQGYLTADPAEFPNAEYEIAGGQNTTFGQPGLTPFAELASGMEYVVPEVNANRFTLDRRSSQKPRLQLESNVLKFLGFDIRRGDTAVDLLPPDTAIEIDNEWPCGFIVQGTDDAQIVNSDSYVVVLDSNPLESYDASQFDYSNIGKNDKLNKRGRRFNILDTIPVNNNNGIVEYNANELVYIDFDNKFPQTLKNIKLRVLNKQLFPIETFGTCTMTLLIDTGRSD